jgi:non-ribosomal peptide synthetase-like protein
MSNRGAGIAIGQALKDSPSGSGSPACLHELFEAQVDANPSAVALICGELMLSYAELDTQANRLANFLNCLGVGPGSLVGLFLERSATPIVAILACLKSGAAYVPLETMHPDDRIAFIASEADIAVILTVSALSPRLGELTNVMIVELDKYADDIEATPDRRLTRADTGLVPADICYVLYTSGTTGRPKGVVAEHRNVTHFIAAFNKACTTTAADRIYQGFALSFDGSVEEIWMAFSNGATLIVPDRNTPRCGNELAAYLSAAGITYLSTVPTLLSTMTEDVPTIRQLVVSGEACPQELVTRWVKPGRKMLNVYGPTEATVNTTIAVLEPGQPVTIGRPIDGYHTLLLDDAMRPVPPGEKGELYVGGPGVSRGYLKQPDLTGNSFVRLYKTGDLVRVNEDGDLEFFGRIDSQIKIRGYRVELSEIEAVLRDQPEIVNAAVHLYDGGAEPCLAAYVVLHDNVGELDRSRIFEALHARLPPYMVPNFLDVLPSLPMLTTGKVDRKNLPEPVHSLVSSVEAGSPPETLLEHCIERVWAKLFKLEHVGVERNFFLDLGGHSLLAAKAVAALHRQGVEISVRDIYSRPTIRALAGHVADSQTQTPRTKPEKRSSFADLKTSTPKPGIALIAAQVLYYLTIFPVLFLPFLLVIPWTVDMLYFRRTVVEVIIYVLVLALCLWPVMLLIGIGSKWILIGRYKPGAYPLWGSYYLRWWLASRLQKLSGTQVFNGTPLAPFIWRLMGAKVGKGCMLRCRAASAWDCISIGDDCSLGADTQISGIRIERGHLLIGKVELGNRCFVGCHSVLGLNVRMGDGASLCDQSLLNDDTQIPQGKSYRGSPAAEAEDIALPPGTPLRRSSLYLSLYCAGQIGAAILFAAVLLLPALLVSFSFAWMIVYARPLLWIPLVIAAVPVVIIFEACFLAWCKSAVLPRLRPGIYEVYSFEYFQFWLASGLMVIVRHFGWLIFTTVFVPPWMRLFGAKVGRHAEMSTVWTLYPDLASIGDGSFLADGSMLSAGRFHLGRFQLSHTAIGRRSFLGNSAILPAGYDLANECLLGVLSAPANPNEPMLDHTDWLGSPAFQLPNRLKVSGFDDKTTYAPTAGLYLRRAGIDAMRILFPPYVATFLSVVGFIILLGVYNLYGLSAAYALMTVLAWASIAVLAGSGAALKWAVMGRFTPVIVPLWSRYVWLNEMIAGAYETLVMPVIDFFSGTPVAGALLRVMGCKVGKHCYIGSSLFSEFDLVSLGDYVALNEVAVIQTHLFEDRVMKSSYLDIGDRCSVGNMSVVLYDSRMEADAVLGPLSLLMKGEVMPSGVNWSGIPTIGHERGSANESLPKIEV